MRKFVYIESEKPNKNGHITHIMEYINNHYQEISATTGRILRNGLWISDLEGYKIINPLTNSVNLVGATRFVFHELLLDNPKFIIVE